MKHFKILYGWKPEAVHELGSLLVTFSASVNSAQCALFKWQAAVTPIKEVIVTNKDLSYYKFHDKWADSYLDTQHLY